MNKASYLIQDTDEYMILLNAAEAEEPFSQLIYDLSNRYPAYKIHQVYEVATDKLEKLLHSEVLEIVKIHYHRWDDIVRTEHLTVEQSLSLLHKPEIWDRASECNDGVYRMWTTELGHSLIEKYEVDHQIEPKK
ncbi:hypothetical protein Back11_57240 [Paenibacillus baekrokdamisoli]|uniref:Uncharacterized protein n=1 Tax=Paenibacillus baekrokdamisoli TaxID=1712516 RepID=A0A3G9JMW1_9BACL|nr:hypothetical protein [Paenibacillus baekrokdamisoli]MBB3072818.1 hypothetical protein [Paenibacillus baekrokdamisoli]BBH24379.1 hypothetical protein Back11_57240 [Paenibacillus baekrokdamisoli]